MNQGIAPLVIIAILGVAYFVCELLRRGTCNTGRMFTLLVLVIGVLTGALIFERAFVSLRAKGPSNGDVEAVWWAALVGLLLCLSSAGRIVFMFRRLFAKKVESIKEVKVSSIESKKS